MERTITFIAETKKREYEQVKEETARESDIPQDPKDTLKVPECHPTE